MSVPNFVQIHPEDAEMFHWINVDVLVMLKKSQGIKKEIRIRPLGNMNACTNILWKIIQ